MIRLLVGLQGAGKTYYAVAEIWNHVKKMHKAEITGDTYKYTKIYTNIEGMKPNKYVEILDVAKLSAIWKWELKQYMAYEKRYRHKLPDDIVFDVDVIPSSPTLLEAPKPLVDVEIPTASTPENVGNTIEVFESDDLKLLENLKDSELNVEPAYIEHTLPHFEERGYVNCLFIIDEAHNFFGQGMGTEFRRLSSYHRHYHGQDYLLITQDTKMLNFSITQLAVTTTRAVNPIMRWKSDVFSYKIYSGGYISFSGDNKLESKTLKAKEVVFNLYNSGGKVIEKSHLVKIFFKFLAFGVLLYVGYKLAIGNFTHQNDDEVVIKDSNKTVKIKEVEIVDNSDDYTLFTTETFMIIGNSIIHNRTHKKFKFKTFELMLGDEDNLISYDKNLDGTITVFYELAPDTLQRLNIRKKLENNSNNITLH